MGRTQEFVCRETREACGHSNTSDRVDASEFSSLLIAFFLTGKISNMSSIATLIRLKSYAKSVTKKGYGVSNVSPMKRIAPIVTVWLIACLLVVSGVLSAQAVEHSQHHAQHHANVHATLLCAWFCAAGQTIETVELVWETPTACFTAIVCSPSNPTQSNPLVSSPSRAPPFSL